MFFSIIVPVYNIEEYVRTCLDSILSQDFQDFELVVVDDGSTDRSGEICDEYSEKDGRVRVVHQVNGGVTNARKTAVEAALGQYIVPIDGDDWVSVELLSELYKILSEEKFDILCYEHTVMYEDKGVPNVTHYREGKYNKEQIESEILPSLIRGANGRRFSGNVWTKAFRRELFTRNQRKVDDRIRIGEDACVVWACVLEAGSIYILRKHLYFYRHNVNSLTKGRKSGYPWSDIGLRLKFVDSILRIQKYDFEDQLERYIVHSLFVIACSHLQTCRKYQNVKREILFYFSMPEYQDAIGKCRYRYSLKELLACAAVKYKLIWLIKIYSYFYD